MKECPEKQKLIEDATCVACKSYEVLDGEKKDCALPVCAKPLVEYVTNEGVCKECLPF